jgi:hypothetical protein
LPRNVEKNIVLYHDIARRVFKGDSSFFNCKKIDLVINKFFELLPADTISKKKMTFYINSDVSIDLKQRLRYGYEFDYKTKELRIIDVELRLSKDNKKFVKNCNFVKEFTQKVRDEIEKDNSLKKHYYETDINS